MDKLRVSELMELIQMIKYDKSNIDDYKDINKYYKYMQKSFNCCSLVKFIEILTNIPVINYVKFDDIIENESSLLNKNGSLAEYWDEWHITMGSNRDVDNKRFNDFRDKCFDLEKQNKGAGDTLYRATRLFIILNSIIESIDSIGFILTQSGIKNRKHKDIAIDYITQCYEILKSNKTFQVCNVCGYIKDTRVSHNLCNGKYEDKLLKNGVLIARQAIYNDIIKPGLFEKSCFEKIVTEGFKAIIFPEIEKEGDILVIINDKNYFLDMKAYNKPEDLSKELLENINTDKVKEKYKNRWIIVPNLYYVEQKEYIGSLLNRNGSRIYNIDDLINKLKREEVEN
jgi:hypothetical protein